MSLMHAPAKMTNALSMKNVQNESDIDQNANQSNNKNPRKKPPITNDEAVK